MSWIEFLEALARIAEDASLPPGPGLHPVIFWIYIFFWLKLRLTLRNYLLDLLKCWESLYLNKIINYWRIVYCFQRY